MIRIINVEVLRRYFINNASAYFGRLVVIKLIEKFKEFIMKKGIVSIIIAGVLCLTMGTTAFAHGHGGGHHGGSYSAPTQSYSAPASSSSSSTPSYSICPLTNCTRISGHYHNGTYYYGHHTGDGHGHTVTGNYRHPGGYSHSSWHGGYHE